jgi:alcohol dehydrogenase, propanol-preferring
MKAAVLRERGKPLALEDRPVPRAAPGEVLVRVIGAGVCGTDLHIIEGAYPDLPLPIVLGHEIAGEADGLGPVLVYASWGCGRCSYCRRGDEQLCPDAREPGWVRDGGYAEWVAVPSRRYLLPLEALDPRHAAPLADAGVTPFRAVQRIRPWLRPTGVAAVIGLGGLGQFAVQFLKLLTSARVSAIDRNESKLAAARDLGADAVFVPAEAPAGCDAVLDFVGTDQSLALASKLVVRGGIIVQIGEGGGKISFGFGKTGHEVTLTTSVWGSLSDLQAVLAHARRGELRWTTEEFPLDQANDALDRLRRGEVRGRAVLCP